MTDNIVIVSMGQHTRLGDVLEYALAQTPFETIEAAELARGNWTNRRLLFAASADQRGENASLRQLAARLEGGECDLSGCAVAMIADGEQGGAMHLDALRLLTAANAAGAEVLARPLIETGRDLRSFAQELGGRESGFERYRSLARSIAERLAKAEQTKSGPRATRLATALDAGTGNDWRAAIRRMLAAGSATLSDDDAETEETILLCENADGLPDAPTLAQLKGEGRVRFLVASPSTGAELYLAALLERACLRGGYSLAPRGVLVFEGKSAVEVLASKAEMERVKGAVAEKINKL